MTYFNTLKLWRRRAGVEKKETDEENERKKGARGGKE